MEPLDDKALTALWTQNREKAIEAIFRQYYAHLCRKAYRLVFDRGLSEDLVQDVFLELWKRQKILDLHTSLSAYLNRAVLNKSLNYLRDHKMRFEDIDETPETFHNQLSVHQQLEVEELSDLVDKVIESLPDRCRIVFVLSRFEALSHKEIAEKLGISAKTVENQIHKALKILKEKLGVI